ncbi:MAG TPA: TIGR04563 family protein [Anaeromyxobacter sp.]
MENSTDKRKQSLYFPDEMLREIQGEATRQDRSLSWIVQQAWKAARAQIAKIPGRDDFGPSERAKTTATAPVAASVANRDNE